MTDVAISIKAALESINGSKHIYPATFADTGHNLVGYDKATGKAEAVQVDSVGSFANRIEAELHGLDILPSITTSVGDRVLSVHELPHRVYDAILRDSLLDDTSWRQSDIGAKVLASTTTNATALYKHAPLTLLLGGWDSHGGDAGTGSKIARSVSCEIWGYGVQTAMHCTQRIDPLGITADNEKHAVIDGILQPDTSGKKPSELGHGDVPSSDKKGVFIDRIELNGAISLTRLSRYHFPDNNGDIDQERDKAGCEVLFQLALVGIARVMDRLDLRSGCELYTTSRDAQLVSSDGSKKPVDLDTATDKLQGAIAKAAEKGLEFASEPVQLKAGPALERLAAKGGV
ncbi:type I-G CRISPR-associated RAMP protein Csb1/Cas7g [Desulfogranum mediterraneum]|uniref:type I-G CRISPR-associated RAMP protein Csb1/Cas7g n=1 Tax=Desulfogranum mediterraneum TaxID=160661 RepID=UPI00042351AF|nr:type I-U CRISPR-associated RAMP protein Csb1/Cas7u [Desulfogranum mediterraneum]